jgi:glyoxylase-like metal-dependent hydrolase (beta-lactamase superfamily II)
MKRMLVLGAVLAVGVLSIAVRASQAPAAARTIEMEKLRDNLYVLKSSTPGDNATFSGGNVSVFVTSTGVTLVDTKLAGWGQALLDDIRKVTDKPVTTVINTHTHGDHTGNNNLFTGAVTFVAHDNTKANMEKMPAFKDANAKFLPSKTFSTSLTLGAGNDRIELHYFGAGHTNGDAWVYFPALRVLQTGDMFAWKDAPLCDRNNGGSCVEFPKTIAKALAAITAVDDVIPGHSPLMKLSDLREYQQFNADFVAQALAAKQAGRSVDEASAAIGAALAQKYRGYQSTRVKAAVQVVYDEAR